MRRMGAADLRNGAAGKGVRIILSADDGGRMLPDRIVRLAEAVVREQQQAITRYRTTFSRIGKLTSW